MNHFCKKNFVLSLFNPFVLILMLLGSSLWAGPRALFETKSFYNPHTGNYIETYLMVFGQNLHYQSIGNGKFQSQVRVDYSFKPDSFHLKSRSLIITGPETLDTIKDRPDFIDVQRFGVPKGAMEVAVVLTDFNLAATSKTSKEFTASISGSTLGCSDIELLSQFSPSKVGVLSSFSKSGFELSPYVSEYYGENAKLIQFYAEFYNTPLQVPDSQMVFLTYCIKNYEDNAVVDNLGGHKRMASAQVLPFIGQLTIEKLPTGHYWLELELKDRNNHVLTVKKQHFYKKTKALELNYEQLLALSKKQDNPTVEPMSDERNYFSIRNRDSLVQLIIRLSPIASGPEKVFIQNDLTKTKSTVQLTQFFYNFWKAQDPADPIGACRKYQQQVRIADQLFGSHYLAGSLTERGRVYLQYGKPDNRIQSHTESGVYPYEIWQYYKIKGQTNKRFVFYEPDFSTGIYQLLHSDVVGEPSNMNWQNVLHKSNDGNYQPNSDFYGDRIQQNFNNAK